MLADSKQAAKPGPPADLQAEAKASEAGKRIELNLLGKTDTEAGESRRNENVLFNLIDNNVLKELNVRLGVTATITSEFRPERNYFGTEFGVPSPAPLHVAAPVGRGWHGNVYASHLNSVFSARKFFQVGDVRPAHENDYGFRAGAPLWHGASLLIDGSQQRLRGNVNRDVLVPRPDERTPLATDPATRAIVTRWLDAYPLPNRAEANQRLLNANALQVISDNNAGLRVDQYAGARDRVTLQYLFASQSVDAFQAVPGQNPDTNTKSHKMRTTWSRQWSAVTATDLTAAFDRLGSLLVPEPNAVGPMVSVSGLETLGPQAGIPINRAQNLYRCGGTMRRADGAHGITAGFTLLRRQFNGIESDAHRGFFSFSNDFGRDAITNFRLGRPSQHIIAVGNVHRGFRNWDLQFFAGDTWKVRSSFTVSYGLRYQPAPTPAEVNRLNTVPYDCDCNNLAPQLGLAWRLPSQWGTLRWAYGLHFGEIFPITFSQVRFSPPGSVKIVVTAPDLVNPLGGATANPLGNLYLLDPSLTTPYSHQYNFSWEPEISRTWKVQLGYVGSRSHKLLIMWYRNRAHPVAGIPLTTATINQRRPNRAYADIRWVLNGSRGYFDAGRVALVAPRWRGLSVDAAYWFSKALDLGSSYTNTAYDGDSRLSRSQDEYETQRDMKGLSDFDQHHAFLWRSSYAIPAPARSGWMAKAGGGWNLSAVVLLKTGPPFNVTAGSDAPGYGNVDGNGGDRPNLLDPSILGRSIGDPDTARERLPRSAFAYMQATEARGNLGRNVFRKGAIRNVNAALARTWAVASDKRLTFRAESINFLNTPQFREPGSELANPNFGFITDTLNDGRTFRFLLQVGW